MIPQVPILTVSLRTNDTVEQDNSKSSHISVYYKSIDGTIHMATLSKSNVGSEDLFATQNPDLIAERDEIPMLPPLFCLPKEPEDIQVVCSHEPVDHLFDSQAHDSPEPTNRMEDHPTPPEQSYEQ